MNENPYSSPTGDAPSMSAASGRSQLVPVAISLLVVSVLWIFFCLFGIVFFTWSLAPAETMPGMARFSASVLGVEMLYSCVLVTGGFSMIRGGSFTWAVVTSCLALVPVLSPFYLLGIPIGVWALVLLRKPEVRASFKKL